MKSFLEYLSEERNFSELDKNSLWCIGTTTEQFNKREGKFLKDNSFAWPMYMTRSVQNAIAYAQPTDKQNKLWTGSNNSGLVVVGKVLKPGLKVFDLQDDADFAQSSFEPQMAELFRLADPFFSFCLNPSLRKRDIPIPVDIFRVHTIAKNFIRLLNGKFTTKTGSRMTNSGWAKLLATPLKIEPITQESFATFKTEYNRVRVEFNATHKSKDHMTEIPDELTSDLEKYVNAYICGFQTVNSLVSKDSTFLKEYDQCPSYADVLQYSLFKDIFNHGFDGYHVEELVKNAQHKADCMALFSAKVFEPICAVLPAQLDSAFDRSDVPYGGSNNDDQINAILKNVEPNYIDWY